MKRPNIKCPYCGSRAYLRPASTLNRHDPKYSGEKYYVCARYPACDSYVKAHSFNQMPMGTLANSSLRRKRRAAHIALQALLDKGLMTRKEAYRWLQVQMGMPEAETHIANFSERRCEEVIRLCHQFSLPHRRTAHRTITYKRKKGNHEIRSAINGCSARFGGGLSPYRQVDGTYLHQQQ